MATTPDVAMVIRRSRLLPNRVSRPRLAHFKDYHADFPQATGHVRCHLWKLPTEIKDIIFDYVFGESVIYCRTAVGNRYRQLPRLPKDKQRTHDSGQQAKLSIDLLLVCRQYYLEAGAAAYRNSAVAFLYTALTRPFLNAEQSLLANIRTVAVDLSDANTIFLHLLAAKCPHIRGVHILGISQACHCCIEGKNGSEWMNNKWTDPEFHWDTLKAAMISHEEVRAWGDGRGRGQAKDQRAGRAVARTPEVGEDAVAKANVEKEVCKGEVAKQYANEE
ncbi:hypothetical protein LTR85_010439 [Meristemomyces frigidus]|nr:hypothetical protein LTR85_010439 [Meristemomyces frigidus]